MKKLDLKGQRYQYNAGKKKMGKQKNIALKVINTAMLSQDKCVIVNSFKA